MSNFVDRYIQVESILATTGIELSVSEVHGTIVGAVTNHMQSGRTPDLLKLIEPTAHGDDDRYTQLNAVLHELYRENSELLLEAKADFSLLLPDDDETIEFRTEAVACWSKGYILGLLYNDAFSLDQLPDNGPEIVRDIILISEATAGSDAEQEEGWALAELEEYLKVTTQLVFESVYSQRASKAPTRKQ